MQHYSAAQPIRTFNFALSGAMVTTAQLPASWQEHSLGIFPVEEQVSLNFVPRCGAKPARCQWASDSAIFIIFGGINDLLNPVVPSTPETRAMVLQHYYMTVKNLRAVGARNFLFLNLPPIHRSDTVTMMTEAMRTNFEHYNTLLRAMRNTLMHEVQDVNVRLFDTYTLWADVLRNPDAFEQTRGVTRLVEPCVPYATLYVDAALSPRTQNC